MYDTDILEESVSDKMARTIRKRIPISEISEYTFLGVYIDEDVINKSGAVLIPKGTEIVSLSKFAPSMEDLLRNSRIATVAILIQEQIDISDLEEIIHTSETIVKIDAKLARDTVAQVSDVYSRIVNGVCEREDINNLVGQGRTLAKVVTEAPEIMLCLGHVRGSDEYTYVHSLNVALIGGFIAGKMFPENDELVQCMSVGGVLHDLGKARIPNAILNKPGPLTDEEFAIMKNHTIYGEELAKQFGVTDEGVLSVVRGHHERYSGNGYPDVLNEERISLTARIAAVADVFDAITAKRAYKEPMECRSAILLMIEKMSPHFDPDILRTLIVSVGLYPPGAAVELSDGCVGVVVGTSGNNLVRPHVMVVFDKYGQRIQVPQVIDLSSKDNEFVFIKRVVRDFGKIAF